MSERPRTIRVLVHLGSGPHVAIGLLRSVWSGAQRVDHRLRGAFPVVDPHPCPPGVDPDLWLAYEGLSAAVRGQRAAWADRHGR